MEASELLNRLTLAKKSQAGAVRYIKEQETILGAKMEQCGSWLHLREWLQHDGATRLINANFCKSYLTCRMCAARRAMRLVGSYKEKVETLQQLKPNLIPAMVTLTVKNGEDLTERITHLKTSWSTMLEMRRKGLSVSSRNRKIEWCKVHGSVRSLEVTKSDKGWHPHAHAFVLIDEYIEHKTLSDEWHEITGDSFIVGVTKCKNGIVPGLIETLKYVTKMGDIEPPDLLQIWRSAKGSRFTDAFGILRGVPEPDIDSDPPESFSGEFRDYFALWFGDGYSMTQKPEFYAHKRNLGSCDLFGKIKA